MAAEQRLAWVARNRARRESARHAGEFIVQAVRGASRTDGAALALLADQLGVVVNEEFNRHCRAAAVRGGRLIVHVDAPSMVSMMQARWGKVLQTAIRARAPRAGATDVLFAFGTTGLPFENVSRSSSNQRATQESPEGAEPSTVYG